VILGAFAKLWKGLLGTSCLSVCVFVWLQGTIQSTLVGFSWKFIFEDSSKICRKKNKVSLKSKKKDRYFTWITQYIYNNIPVSSSSNNKCSDKSVERIKTYTLYVQHLFPWKSSSLWDNVEKYGTAGRATDDHTAHALYMLDNYDYRHALRICNPPPLPMAPMVTRMTLSVTIHVHCLSCYT
jgi:hypothetical protein